VKSRTSSDDVVWRENQGKRKLILKIHINFEFDKKVFKSFQFIRFAVQNTLNSPLCNIRALDASTYDSLHSCLGKSTFGTYQS
jgi:hypothetical protein